MQQRGWPKIPIAVPPIRWARRGTTRTHHTFVQAIKLFTVFNGLLPLFRGATRLRFKPWLDRGVLRIEVRQIRDQILDNWQVGKRVNLHVAINLVKAIDTGQRVDPINVHRTRSTNAFAAGPAECQGWINFILNFDQRVQNHRAAGIHIHKVRIQ